MAGKRRSKLTTKNILKKAEQAAPQVIGGAAALAASPIIDGKLGKNFYAAQAIKTASGLVLTALDNDYAKGAGTVLAAFGVGAIVNKLVVEYTAEGKPIPGLPAVPPKGVTTVAALPPAYRGNNQTIEAARSSGSTITQY